MEVSPMEDNKKGRFQKLLDGYAWASHDPHRLTAYLLLYLLLILLIGWHTDQALCYFAGTDHLFGLPYLVIGLLGILTLLHEADYVWKHREVKVPIGLACTYFIYYCMMELLWIIIESLLRLSAEISALGSILFAVTSGILVAVGYRNTGRIRTVSYRIPLLHAASNFSIVLISDLHLGDYVGEAHVKRIVKAANTTNPDLVIIAGDLIDDDNSILSEPAALKQVAEAFRQLQSKYGTVLTLGNHDPNADDTVFLAFLKESQIRLLHNQIMELPEVNVVGISDPAHNKRIPIETLLTGRNLVKPIIVADHDPRYADAAVRQNADLILSGHTHAGQFFPVSVLTKIALGKNKYYGHHKLGDTHTVVTSGAGFFNLPVRIGTHNEIVKITLTFE